MCKTTSGRAFLTLYFMKTLPILLTLPFFNLFETPPPTHFPRCVCCLVSLAECVIVPHLTVPH